MSLCSVPDCSKIVIARGWCNKHYLRWQKHGDPLKSAPPRIRKTIEWIEDHANYAGDECLIWPFARHPTNGYPEMYGDRANGVMCSKAHGPPPTPEHEVAHSCGKGHEGCINPRHLRWATKIENYADRILHGTDTLGERNGSALLSRQQVLNIYQRRSEDANQLSAEFGVIAGTIRKIWTGERWSSVTGIPSCDSRNRKGGVR